MALDPQFISVPKQGAATVSTADASLTAPTNFATVFTAAASGSLVDRLSYKALGTTSAGLLRWFLHDGTNYRLLTERSVAAVTPSASLATAEETISPVSNPELLPIKLPAGWTIRATTSVAQSIQARAEGGDL